MTPETYSVDQLRGDILRASMDRLLANPRLLPPGYYSATVERDVAMLVEPLNEAPFVFVPPVTIHAFKSAPGSGTDFLRARIAAGLFFQGVVDAARQLPATSSPADIAQAAPRPRRQAV